MGVGWAGWGTVGLGWVGWGVGGWSGAIGRSGERVSMQQQGGFLSGCALLGALFKCLLGGAGRGRGGVGGWVLGVIAQRAACQHAAARWFSFWMCPSRVGAVQVSAGAWQRQMQVPRVWQCWVS